jgi:hypothetical protein
MVATMRPSSVVSEISPPSSIPLASSSFADRAMGKLHTRPFERCIDSTTLS